MKDFASHCPDDCTPTTGVHADPLAELFALVSERSEAEEKALNEEARHIASMIGHNGGPEIVEPFGITAPWFQHAQMAEVEELANPGDAHAAPAQARRRMTGVLCCKWMVLMTTLRWRPLRTRSLV